MTRAAKPQVKRRKYRQLSHTADLGWRIWGESLPQLFENAGAALISTLVDRRQVRRRETRDIALDSIDQEALLVDWLNHLLYLFDVDGFLGRKFQVSRLTATQLTARAWGERFDPARHAEKTAVKAATYHKLQIVRKGTGWEATVILDL